MTVQSIGAGKLVLFQDGTITASTPITFSQTWNNSGVQFYGLKIGITDTASATSSEPFSIQVGGSDIVTILKSGEIQSVSNIAAGTNRQLYFVSRSTIASSADGLLTIANNAGTGFTGLILGTSDTSGIRLKKNTTAFNFRLGDDSADASFTAASATLSGAVVVGSPTGGSKGNGTVNATGLYVNGTAVSTSASLIVGTTVVSSGTSTRILYDNAGVLGEYTLTGSGTVVAMAGGPTFTSNTTISSSSLITSGAISAAAWTTTGIREKMAAASYTDTSSSGTVATAYSDFHGATTILASSATTYTNYYGAYFQVPVASTNVTMTNKSALGADSISIGGAAQSTFAAAITGTMSVSGNITGLGTLNSFGSGTAGNLILTNTGATDSIVYPNSTAGTIGFLAGTTTSFAAANGSYFVIRGNSYSQNANQRGNLYISSGNPTTPGAAEGSINFLTGADVVRFIIDKNGLCSVTGNLTTTGTITNTGGLSGAGNISTGGNYTATATATTQIRLNSAGVFGTIDNIDAHTWDLGYGGTPVIKWTDNGAVTIAPNNSIMNVTGQCYSTTLRTAQTTVSGLPSASISGAGALAFVTDASTTVILGLGTTVVGSGSNKVPVYSDGTNWIVG